MGKTKNKILLQVEPIRPRKRNWVWTSVAVTFFVLTGIGVFGYLYYRDLNQNEDQVLGTYDDPEVAFRETQKALLILSNHLNVGIESVQYIQEYDNSKNLIFKQQ